MRIFVGSGYRIYFVRDGNVIIILLCGGRKSSQAADIKRAKTLQAYLQDEKWEADSEKEKN